MSDFFFGLKRPVFVEFAGMPGAGKTTTIDILDHFFRREGKSVRVITEGAQACPIDQDCRVQFAAWTAHRLLNVLLEESYCTRGYDLMLIDRGLFDVQAFIRLLLLESKASEEQVTTMIDYLRLSQWSELTDVVFLFDIPARTALRRHAKNSLTQQPGPILNGSTLQLLQDCYDEIADQYRLSRPGVSVERFAAAKVVPRRAMCSHHLEVPKQNRYVVGKREVPIMC